MTNATATIYTARISYRDAVDAVLAATDALLEATKAAANANPDRDYSAAIAAAYNARKAAYDVFDAYCAIRAAIDLGGSRD